MPKRTPTNCSILSESAPQNNMRTVGLRTGKPPVFALSTRAITDRFKNAHRLQHAFASLFDQLPDVLKNLSKPKPLSSAIDRKVYNIVHMIYHTQSYESDSRDYEFSRLSMNNHWKHGYRDALHTLAHPEVLEVDIFAESNYAMSMYFYARLSKAKRAQCR
jgi:NTE family protein